VWPFRGPGHSIGELAAIAETVIAKGIAALLANEHAPCRGMAAMFTRCGLSGSRPA